MGWTGVVQIVVPDSGWLFVIFDWNSVLTSKRFVSVFFSLLRVPKFNDEKLGPHSAFPLQAVLTAPARGSFRKALRATGMAFAL